MEKYDFKRLIYKDKKSIIMKPKRGILKQNVSITLDPKVYKMLLEETSNNSKLIEWLLLNYFQKIGKKTDDIMI